ncbi:MAG: hypothetical protein ABI166_07280, partial [Mucilaginibacter sp.]
VFAGYSLDGDHVDAGPLLKLYVDEALDEIEYVTGDVHTYCGAKRAADGHPAPFKLSYVEIGNEDGLTILAATTGVTPSFMMVLKPNILFCTVLQAWAVRIGSGEEVSLLSVSPKLWMNIITVMPGGWKRMPRIMITTTAVDIKCL